MIEIRKAGERGYSNLGWLESHHTFSFADYYDPDQSGFSDLLVINDDRVQPGTGFPTHPHRDMEIFSYVLDGALAHRDSMGHGAVIRPGDVQMMSAGTGITHSEFNPDPTDLVHFLQIWIVPRSRGIEPCYRQAHFDPGSKRGKFRRIISPVGDQGSLAVHQDVNVHAGLFDPGESARIDLGPDRYAYVHLARGTATINGIRLVAGDGARLRHETSLHVANGDGAELLVFDLRAKEAPRTG